MWEGGYGYPVVADYERLDTGLVGALEQWLSPECVYVDTDRIVALGTADNVIINVLPREILVLLLIAGNHSDWIAAEKAPAIPSLDQTDEAGRSQPVSDGLSYRHTEETTCAAVAAARQGTAAQE